MHGERVLKVALLASLLFGVAVPLAAVVVGGRPRWRRLLRRRPPH